MLFSLVSMVLWHELCTVRRALWSGRFEMLLSTKDESWAQICHGLTWITRERVGVDVITSRRTGPISKLCRKLKVAP